MLVFSVQFYIKIRKKAMEGKIGNYLWYPVWSPALRIMPETTSPARGSRNLTPRIEPPVFEYRILVHIFSM